MNDDILTSFRPALVMTILFALLLGILYPLVITGVAQVALPWQANGSIVRDAAGQAIGSALIGQNFAGAGYFHPRPSAAGKAGYDPTASSGSNYGPTSQALVDRVTADMKALPSPAPGRPLPPDLVTASASGLDPDLSPEAALYQVDRVAKARGLPVDRVRALVETAVETPLLPFLGDAHVNVLALNRQLDAIGASKGG